MQRSHFTQSQHTVTAHCTHLQALDDLLGEGLPDPERDRAGGEDRDPSVGGRAAHPVPPCRPLLLVQPLQDSAQRRLHLLLRTVQLAVQQHPLPERRKGRGDEGGGE